MGRNSWPYSHGSLTAISRHRLDQVYKGNCHGAATRPLLNIRLTLFSFAGSCVLYPSYLFKRTALKRVLTCPRWNDLIFVSAYGERSLHDDFYKHWVKFLRKICGTRYTSMETGKHDWSVTTRSLVQIDSSALWGAGICSAALWIGCPTTDSQRGLR